RILERVSAPQRLPSDQIPAAIEPNLFPDDARRAEPDVVGVFGLARIILVGLSPGQIIAVVRPKGDGRISNRARLDVQGSITTLQSGADRLRIDHWPWLAIGLLGPKLGIGLDWLRHGVTGEHGRECPSEERISQLAHEGLSVESPFTWFVARGVMEGDLAL